MAYDVKPTKTFLVVKNYHFEERMEELEFEFSAYSQDMNFKHTN